MVGGRYRLEAVLGAGGYATVYRATDLHDGGAVAVKVVRPDADGGYSRELRARTEREVMALARLTSPHTVRLHEHGITADGLLYLVFEHVPGADLAVVLETHATLPDAVVAHVLRQLLDALGEAHRAGLLHRDIKPENVRVFEEHGDPWRVKLLDFGIARSTEPSRPQVTADGVLVGTPRYMSPEQLTARELTSASDIYSLGIVAFEMMVGRDALHGNHFGAQLDRLRSGHLFAAPDGRVSALHQTVQRMTALKLADRLRTVDDVLSVLSADVDATLIAPPRSTRRAAAPAAHGSRLTWPAAVAALTAIGVVLIIGVTMGTVSRPPGEPAPRIDRKRLPSIVKVAPSQHVIDDAPVEAAVEAAVETPVESVDGGSDGCGQRPPFRGSGTLRFTGDFSGAGWRTYIPEGYSQTKKAPLVIILHSKFSSPDLVSQSNFDRLAEVHDFVVIAPSDTQPAWQEPWLDPDAPARLRSLVDETGMQLCLDPARVFVVGQGGAAEVVQQLQCADWVRATAQSGFGAWTIPDTCERAIPAIWLSATRSPDLPLEGGRNCLGRRPDALEFGLNKWRKRQGCSATQERSFVDGPNRCTAWVCAVPFEHCLVDGGDPWPGFDPRPECKEPPSNFPAAEQIWRFFATVAPPEL